MKTNSSLETLQPGPEDTLERLKLTHAQREQVEQIMASKRANTEEEPPARLRNHLATGVLRIALMMQARFQKL